MPESQEPNPWRLMTIGLELAAAVGILMWVGYLIDRWLGSEPWGVLIGAMLGLSGGLYNLIKAVNRVQK